MGVKAQRWIVMSDLDGSLLDHHTYAYDAALPALSALKDAQIPLVLNTSKTRSECQNLAKQLGLLAPIVVENGGGISLPTRPASGDPYGHAADVEFPEDLFIRLGVSRESIHRVLDEIATCRSLRYRSFAQMSLDELRDRTGLDEASAINAQLRQVSEPLLWEDSAEALAWFTKRLQRKGLTLTQGGRFHTVSGKHDKGGALHWVRSFFHTLWHMPVHILALGDGPNDLSMLEAADQAICVRSPVHPPLEGPQGVYSTTHLEGPSGWNESLLNFLNEIKTDTSIVGLTGDETNYLSEDLRMTV